MTALSKGNDGKAQDKDKDKGEPTRRDAEARLPTGPAPPATRPPQPSRTRRTSTAPRTQSRPRPANPHLTSRSGPGLHRAAAPAGSRSPCRTAARGSRPRPPPRASSPCPRRPTSPRCARRPTPARSRSGRTPSPRPRPSNAGRPAPARAAEPGRPAPGRGARASARADELDKQGWVRLKHARRGTDNDVQRELPGLDDEAGPGAATAGTTDPNAHADKEQSFEVETPPSLARGRPAPRRARRHPAASAARAARPRDEGKIDTVLHKVEHGENFWSIAAAVLPLGPLLPGPLEVQLGQGQAIDKLYVGT